MLQTIAGVLLIGQDALRYVTAQQANRRAAMALVQDFVDHPLIALMSFGYLLVYVFAYPLLAIALPRARVLALGRSWDSGSGQCTFRTTERYQDDARARSALPYTT